MGKKEVSHADRDHAEHGLSPSGMSKTLGCLKSVDLEKDMPNTDTIYTRRGTELHEICDVAGAAAMNGNDNPLAGVDDEEGVEVAQYFLDVRKDIIEKIGEDHIVNEMFEARVQLTENIWGSADWVLIYNKDQEKRAIVWDHKFGKVPVSPVENAQGITYALAVREQFEWEKCTVVIYQPLSGEEQSVKQWVITKDRAMQWKEELLDAEKRVLEAAVTGDYGEAKVGDHCKWCRGKVKCATYKKDMETKALMVLDEAPPLMQYDEKGKPVFDISQTTPEQRSAALTYRDEIIAFFKAIEAYEVEMQKRGEGMEDWKLVEGRASRTWKDDTAHIAASLKKLGVEDPYNKKLKGIGAIETAIVDNIPSTPELKTKKAKKELVKKQISGLVQLTEPAPKLVKAADSRPELDFTPAIDMVGDLT